MTYGSQSAAAAAERATHPTANIGILSHMKILAEFKNDPNDGLYPLHGISKI